MMDRQNKPSSERKKERKKEEGAVSITGKREKRSPIGVTVRSRRRTERAKAPVQDAERSPASQRSRATRKRRKRGDRSHGGRACALPPPLPRPRNTRAPAVYVCARRCVRHGRTRRYEKAPVSLNHCRRRVGRTRGAVAGTFDTWDATRPGHPSTCVRPAPEGRGGVLFFR